MWIARALGHPVEAVRLVGAKPKEWLVPHDDKQTDAAPDATRMLTLLLDLAVAAERTPLHLFKNSSMALVEKVTSKRKPTDLGQLSKMRAQAQQVVADAWFWSPFNRHPDERDRWIAALHPALNPAEAAEQSDHLLAPLETLPALLHEDADVVSVSRQLWEPLLRHRKPAQGHKKLSVNGHKLADWTSA